MDNMNDPKNQAYPEAEFRSLENKVRTLEQQLAEQQDQLRDYEKSLVERIADVDDDRRMTASKLQRAWQSQIEEINARLRRQMVIVIGALIMFFIVVGVVLFYADYQATDDRQLLAEDLVELRQELGRTSSKSGVEDSLRAELTRLSATVNAISSSQGMQDEKQADSLYTILEDERIAREEADAVNDTEVRQLEAKLESLMREMETLREALETEETTKAESTQEPAEAIPDATVEQPFDGGSGKTATDVSPDSETSQTLFVENSTYALQLIGFYDLDSLLRFVENRNDLPERLYYRKESVQGRLWYSLIHSLFEDYASAQAQLHNLSPELVAMDPWLRPIRAGVELKVLDAGSKRRP
jgi:DamX protein